MSTEHQWKAWGEFCQLTNREALWGDKICQQFKKLLGKKIVLDIGTNTGEFAKEVAKLCTVSCIDIADYRSETSLPFQKTDLTGYTGPTPEVLIFKQCFHLIPNGFAQIQKYPEATIILIQMPKPSWEGDTESEWEKSPFNIMENQKILELEGRKTELFHETIELEIDPFDHEQLILEGYTSYLRAKSLRERIKNWETIADEGHAALVLDKLSILIAAPISK